MDRIREPRGSTDREVSPARISVTVVCFGAMREFLPDGAAAANRAEIQVDRGATVGDVVDALGAPRRLVVAVLVDGRQAALDQVVAEGAEVTLMPAFTGG